MAAISAESASIFAISIFALWTYAFYQRKLSPLASIPGPFLASITSLWIAYVYRRQDFHRYVIKMHKQYGPIVRVAPDGVSVSDIGAIKLIYGSGSKFFKGKWYRYLQDSGSQNLLGMMDEKRHKELRRLVDPIYALKSIRESESLMDEPIAFFTEQMRRQAGSAIDIIEWMNVLAVDIITATVYGSRYGLLDRGHAPEMLEFTESGWSTYFWACMLPLMGKVVRTLHDLKILARVILSGGKPPLPIFAWTVTQVEDSLQAENYERTTPTLLQKFVRLHKERPKEFPRAALDNQMFASVFAGFETCGATMPKIIRRVVLKDGCQRLLQKELDEARQHGILKGLMSYDQLRELPYLSACISEGFRMDPVTGLILSRQVPTGGVEMSGVYIPAGTEIGINPWVLSYNDHVMTQPNEFWPERWLEASKPEKMLMDRMDLMFSAGPSNCPGKALALALVYKVIAVIFSNFEVTVVDPNQKIEEINIFPVKWRNVKMRLTPRP